MTIVDALSRVSEIQARLVQLNDLVSGASTSAASTSAASNRTAKASSAAAAGGFAEALAAATSPTGVVKNSAGATGSDVVGAAEKYLGVPYVFGGKDSSGMDCSGLVQRVYADLGIDVPRLVSGQMTLGTEVGSLAEAKPGDLIVTGGGEHILIYAGNNQVIHAPYEGRTVCKVAAYMDDSDITTIRRVIPDRPVGTGTAPANSADLVTAAFSSLFTGASSSLTVPGRTS